MLNQYKHLFLLLFLPAIISVSCKKETEIRRTEVIDGYVYDVNGETLYQTNVDKNKQKTPEQFISILHANLFQSTISQNDLSELSEVRLALGDKQLADELILNNYVNSGTASIPSNTEMRENITQFINATYIRFFLREPTPYELFELKKAIEDDPGLTPELIYQAFALSNEYKFF